MADAQFRNLSLGSISHFRLWWVPACWCCVCSSAVCWGLMVNTRVLWWTNVGLRWRQKVRVGEVKECMPWVQSGNVISQPPVGTARSKESPMWHLSCSSEYAYTCRLPGMHDEGSATHAIITNSAFYCSYWVLWDIVAGWLCCRIRKHS